MSKKNRPASAAPPAPTSLASTLIAQRMANVSSIPAPSDAAIAELKLLVEHNDAAKVRERVPCADAIDMLRTFGWAGSERGALDTVCRAAFGRKSYGTK